MNKLEAAADNNVISVSRRDPRIPVVTLSRESVRNAVNVDLSEQLEAAVREIEADDRVRAAIITGEGAVFSAGADLSVIANGGLDRLFTKEGGFAGFVDAPRAKPWIAAVNGPALAGGFEIVLACDIVVAADDARFALPEVTRGLIASAGGLYRLPRALPKAVAFEMILTGCSMDVADAAKFGLVNHVVERDDLMGRAFEIAEKIAAAAPLAVRESLEIAKKAIVFDDANSGRLGDRAQKRLGKSADFVEGATAFLEKRKPNWAGY